MPFVPVVDFWSTEQSISITELRMAMQGRGSRYEQVIVPADDAEALAAELGVSIGAGVATGAPDDIRAAVARGALGLLRATDVGPQVRALAIGGVDLFGNNRIGDIATWPLVVTVPAFEVWDQAGSWTLAAAGDIMLDRGVAEQTTILGKGADYLFDGGTARVTRIRCCSFYGYEYPATEKTGNRGSVRDLLSGADLAIANLESAVLVDAPYHAGGFTFTADASLLDGLAGAGFDFISLANNHSHNGGSRGLLTAMRELAARGIAHAGAGADDEAAARPAYLEVNGITVAFVSCDAISRFSWAKPDKVGTMSCRGDGVAESVSTADAVADVVIVFPHWGREYRAEPVGTQRQWAREWIRAGADLVIGAHSHVAGAVEEVDGRLVFYSLGNFIFDQDFSTPTMMGAVPELTFNGGRLVQAELHATLIIDAQPNLVLPGDGGRLVLDQMRDVPRGIVLD